MRHAIRGLPLGFAPNGEVLEEMVSRECPIKTTTALAFAGMVKLWKRIKCRAKVPVATFFLNAAVPSYRDWDRFFRTIFYGDISVRPGNRHLVRPTWIARAYLVDH